MFLLIRGLVVPLPQDHPILIGRDNEQCEIALVDERISRTHAEITYANGRFFVRDLGSVNGTFVNGDRTSQQTPLVEGDVVEFPPYSAIIAGENHPQVTKSHQRVLISTQNKKEGVFSGQLNIIPVTDVIQLLNTTRQSGTLEVFPARGKPARLQILEGEICDAAFLTYKQEEAVYAVLAVRDGAFSFTPREITPPDERIEKSTLSMLLEGCRRIDEKEGIHPPPPTHTVHGPKTRVIKPQP
jgi:hypothetical protein